MEESKTLSVAGLVRTDILSAAYKAGKAGAHIAPSLSLVEICLAILQEFDPARDSFVLSKGHGALGYYAAMHRAGIITDEQFASFEEDGGEFPGQPSRSAQNHVEYSSGSLGMGLPYALGAALGKRGRGGTVYAVVGDGELNEGSNWEAAALASRYRLDDLCVIVDQNTLQSDGSCDAILGQDLRALFGAHGWQVAECDGHCVPALQEAMRREHRGQPLAVLAKTVKGKGVSFMENNNAWHHAVLNEEDCRRALQEIGEAYGKH